MLSAFFFWSPRKTENLRRSVSQRHHFEKCNGAKKNRTNFKSDKFFPTAPKLLKKEAPSAHRFRSDLSTLR